MKIFKFALIVILTFAILFGGYKLKGYYDDNYTKVSKVLEEVTELEKMEKIIAENDVVYVYMGRPSCGDSDDFEEYFVEDVKKRGLEDKIYFFNINEINKKYEENNEYKTIIKEAIGLEFTPTMAKYENGKLVLVSEWTPASLYNKEMYNEFLKESGLINE